VAKYAGTEVSRRSPSWARSACAAKLTIGGVGAAFPCPAHEDGSRSPHSADSRHRRQAQSRYQGWICLSHRENSDDGRQGMRACSRRATHFVNASQCNIWPSPHVLMYCTYLFKNIWQSNTSLYIYDEYGTGWGGSQHSPRGTDSAAADDETATAAVQHGPLPRCLALALRQRRPS
jgi:hypothetical protein